MSPIPDPLHNLELHCELCREDVRDRIAVVDRRLLALEIIVRGENGHNGMKSQLNKLCERFDQFEKKAIRLIAIGTALPGIVVGVLAVLRFIGKL
ncbi:MAG: hypothetical protein ACFUZC_10235 [Chthoniobacteraceae bacterium]